MATMRIFSLDGTPKAPVTGRLIENGQSWVNEEVGDASTKVMVSPDEVGLCVVQGSEICVITG